MFTDGSGYDSRPEIAKEDAQQAEIRPGMQVYLNINPWAIYVKEAQYFIDQGGLDSEWGETWVGPFPANSFNHARKLGEAMRLLQSTNTEKK